jgi:hypothetical protein
VTAETRPTPGPWRKGISSASVVSDTQPTYRKEHPSHYGYGSFEEANAAEVKAYGGYLIAESICPENQDVIAAALELYEVLRRRVMLVDLLALNALANEAGTSLNEPSIFDQIVENNRAMRAALAKAEGR